MLPKLVPSASLSLSACVCECVFVCECVALQPLSAQRWQRESEREHPQVPLPCNAAALSPAVSICSPSLSVSSLAQYPHRPLSIYMCPSPAPSAQSSSEQPERGRESAALLAPSPRSLSSPRASQLHSIALSTSVFVSLSPCLPVSLCTLQFPPCASLCSSPCGTASGWRRVTPRN